MYFWRIEDLKEQLRQAALPALPALGYLLALQLLFSVSAEIAARTPRTGDAWETLASVIGYASLLLGTYAAYLANGGRTGRDFAGRFLALMWVLSIRVIVWMVLFFIVIALALGIVLALVSPEALESETMWEWTGLAYISVWILIFYYRLYRHFQGLSGTGTTSLSSVAAN